ncbi:MAG: 23S rRNA (uracil(1939)-C(5))-methyltransferase RlmD [Erysipelotrichaceae bacterium]|nr:23S rRNA (uracil(1939)-C(5))-methyltransferase RlmD [Erysipelotrichaceae bacterium]
MKLNVKKTGINGEGIAYFKRKPVFIEGCFPGETVECTLEDQGRYFKGKLVHILKKSPDRISCVCPYQKECGGCALMPLEYQKQLEIKKELLMEALHKYARFKQKIDDIVPSEKRLSYRNRSNMPVVEEDGKLVSAMYRSGSNHPIPIEQCPVHDVMVERIRSAILQILNSRHYSAYSQSEKKGIRQLSVRGFDNEYQAVIITGNDVFDQKTVDALSKIENLVSIYQGINTQKDPIRMMPERLKRLYGKEKITVRLDDYSLSLSPQAFFQLNRDQAERIYKDAVSFVPEGSGRVVEAYCGIGTISLYLSGKAEEVIGIELEKEAVKDATENAERNGCHNLRFLCSDASRAIRKLLEKQKADMLIVDPPRTGLDQDLIETLLQSKIKRLVYISCNPATLGKDLNQLQKKYMINSVKGYDMFPNTPLVETIVCLDRKC